jgi:hypothetical protein
VAVAIFSLVTYSISLWALADDLQRHELLTIVPMPALYAAAVGVFYFLLPDSVWSQIINLTLFGVGLYALYLTANIFSVAKGRTIQLLHAAHAIGLFFTMLMSLFFLNTIFSQRLPFYWNSVLTGLVHFPLSFLFLWSVTLESRIERQLIFFAGLATLLMMQLTAALSFFPFSVWHAAVLLMSTFYIALGVLQNFLKNRLFQSTIYEYSFVAGLVILGFLVFLPGK